MKRAIYVDYENVNISGLKGIEELTHDDVVKIFIGAQASKLTMVDANRIFNCEASVELITNKHIGKNALDFIIMVHMGYDIAQGLAKSYYIISKDKGYDPAIHEMRKMSGLTVARREDLVAVLDEKKGFGKRIKGLLGIGKVKETPDTTEHTVVGKGKKDSNEFSRITKDYVKEDDSKPGKKKDKNSRPKKTKEKPVKDNKTEEKKSSRENKPEEKKPAKGRKAEEKMPVKERNFEEKKVTESRYAGKKQASEAVKKEIEKPVEKPVEQVEKSEGSTGVDKQENRGNRNNSNYRNNRYNNRNRRPRSEKASSEHVENKVENQHESQEEQPTVNQPSQKKQKERRMPEVVEKIPPEVKDDPVKEVSKTEVTVNDTVKKDVSVAEPVSEVQTQSVEASEEKNTGSRGDYHRNHHGRGRGRYNNHRGHNRNHHSNDGEKRVDDEMPVEKSAPVEKPASVVKSPEEIERERQRNEAFALLAELDEQENNNTQFSYKKYK